MREELTHEELDEIFYGPKPHIEVRFYDQETLDINASKKAGERKFRKQAYIELRCEREKSHIIRPKQDLDEREYRQAWQAYLQEKENERHRQIPDDGNQGLGVGEALAKTRLG